MMLPNKRPRRSEVPHTAAGARHVCVTERVVKAAKPDERQA